MAANLTKIISQLVPGLSQSAAEFYNSIEEHLGVHQLQNVELIRVNLVEGELLSAKRAYLEIRRGEYAVHVCAAPFGHGVFISAWLGQIELGLRAWLVLFPIIGGFLNRLFKALTYYRVDTALMLQSIAHGAVLSSLDAVAKARVILALSVDERKPVMQNLLERING